MTAISFLYQKIALSLKMIDKVFPSSLFELAVEQTYDSILITDADLDIPGPKIIYVNDSFCRKTGYSRDELIGKTPRILQGEMTNRSLLKQLRKTLESRQRFEGSTINYRKDGEPYVVRWSISPLINEAGEIVNFVSIQRDITDQFRLENFNQRLLGSLAEGVFCVNNQNEITYINQAAISILGYQHEESLLGFSWHVLLKGHALNIYDSSDECLLKNVIKTGFPVHNSIQYFVHQNGIRIPVEVSASAVRFDTGNIYGAVVVFSDISLRLEMEQKIHEASLETEKLYETLCEQHKSLLTYVEEERANDLMAQKVFNHALRSRSNELTEIHTIMISASTFSGDMVLSAKLPNGDIRVLLGDFTGHGLAAAIVALPVSDLFYTLSEQGSDQVILLTELNKRLCKLLPDDRFMATTIVDVSKDKLNLTLWSGGMPACHLLQNTELKTINLSGLPLGILEAYDFSSGQVHLSCEKNSRLLIMSDGFLDIRNIEQLSLVKSTHYEEFINNWKKSLLPLNDLVKTAVNQHCLQQSLDDDVTIVEIDLIQ